MFSSIIANIFRVDLSHFSFNFDSVVRRRYLYNMQLDICVKLKSNTSCTPVFPELCAVEDLQVCCGFLKILIVYTSFQPKLSQCRHEVMVDNVGDCVMLPKKW